ncbi:hypothetical protein FRC14_004262 [Serendipita sp. 396]|nr:hypothetical protein FRC14_004262 [Serendipita sp. 396]KAG8802173.1 hypothetical protein FRC16_010215 [Serendipita sp. 398]
MGKVLIIDDSNTNIKYTPENSWSSETLVGPFSNEYGTSIHKSTTRGDTMEYTFEGVGISVYGTLNKATSQGQPNIVFSIDNGSPASISAHNVGDEITSHILFYQSPVLVNGTHTLKAISTGGGSAFYFDFLTVDTAREDAVGDVIVDDRDLGVLYSGTWDQSGTESEYLYTTSKTPKGPNGGTATFTFEGTAIAVYGTTDSNGRNGGNATHVAFTLDGITTQYNGIPNSGAIKNVQLFSNQSLSNGKHTLSFTLLDANICYFDYLVYTSKGGSGSGSGGDGNGNGGGGGAGNGSSSKTNVGAIVGGVVGGIVVLVVLVLGLIFCLRKRKERKSKAEEQRAAEPYALPTTNTTSTTAKTAKTESRTYIAGGTTAEQESTVSRPFTGVTSSFFDGGSQGRDSIAYTAMQQSQSGHGHGHGGGIHVPTGPDYRHPDMLYPQYEGMPSSGLYRPPPSTVLSDEPDSPAQPQYIRSTNEKSRFHNNNNNNNSSTNVNQSSPHSLPSQPSFTPHTISPPTSSFAETDSGLRLIPPPHYTAD